jgi:Arc/MetJ family transcription regulator
VFIGPLRRIDDAIAAQVAHTFYEQLLGERQTVGEALRIAKVEAKDKHFDPATAPEAPVSSERVARTSWAGLVLYGNSTATIGQRVGASSLHAPNDRKETEDDGED